MKTINYKKIKENTTFGIIMFLMLYVLVTLVAFTIHAAEVKNNKIYNTEPDKNGLYNGFEVEPTEGDTIHIYFADITSFKYDEEVNARVIIKYTNDDQNIWGSSMYITIEEFQKLLSVGDANILYYSAENSTK